MYIKRTLAQEILKQTKHYPVVMLTGARQSGKTTLLQNLFPQYEYLTLEDPDTLRELKDDTRAYLARKNVNMIIDEAQRFPELFSYIQTIVDEEHKPGKFILSGSQSFLLNERISQSLAGRSALLTLFPLTAGELNKASLLPVTRDDYLFKGGYPKIYANDLIVSDYLLGYRQTYIERDIRQMKEVVHLKPFTTFIGLSAHHVARQLNITEIASAAQTSTKTINRWLSILEASYLTFTIQPYYKNFGKRLIKTPKFYYWDTGLACNLLGFSSPDELFGNKYTGALFENMVVSEIAKGLYYHDRMARLYYWRDSSQNEIDLIVDRGVRGTTLIEIKSSTTYKPASFSIMDKLGELFGASPDNRYLVYGGTESFTNKHGHVLSYKNIDDLFTS